MQSLFILADESPLDLLDWQVQPLSWSSSLVKSESSWQQLCVWSQSLRQALFNMYLYRVLSREAAANVYLFSVFHPKTLASEVSAVPPTQQQQQPGTHCR